MLTLVASLGPLFLTVTVKWMVSPTLGVALSTVFVTTRSAVATGVTVEDAVLLAVFGSNWSEWLTLAVLVKLGKPAAVTVPWSVRVADAPLLSVPMVHTPPANVPWLGVAETNE